VSSPDKPPRLLLVAHGTASRVGTTTTGALVEAVQAARPTVAVSICFLDVTDPRLHVALVGLPGPVVLVPLLLSTGYHVQDDIPAAVANRPDVRLARHLGPHPLLTDALVDRLPAGDGTVVLVGTGSSRPEAMPELAEAGALLADRVGQPVTVLTMADELRARLGELPPPRRVATYLLAEGRFVDLLCGAASGIAAVAAPLGAHPALVRLVWTRYDEAVDGTRWTVRNAPVG
jgi:sirohydrochlorin ferrochelatase